MNRKSLRELNALRALPIYPVFEDFSSSLDEDCSSSFLRTVQLTSRLQKKEKLVKPGGH